MEKLLIIFLSLARNQGRACILFCASIFTIQSHASETNVSEREREILKSCDTFKTEATHSNALICTYYIQGYLAGAWEVNNVKSSKLMNKQEPLTLTKRAYNNRVGIREERFQSHNTTYFCAPNDNPVQQVLNNLSKNLESSTESIPALHTQIFNAIKDVCPSDGKGGK